MKWINFEDKLPNDGDSILVYLGNYIQSDKFQVVMFVKGISKKEREELKRNNTKELVREHLEPVKYKDGSSPRWNTYTSADEFANNTVPYKFNGNGPMSYFGQEGTQWMPLPEIPNN